MGVVDKAVRSALGGGIRFAKKGEDTVAYDLPETSLTTGGAATLSNGWSVSIVNVTPDVAREMLAKNTSNRSIKKSAVVRYATIMKSGNWTLSPDGLVFSKDRLIQGQHRLHAVIFADVPVDFIVWTNVGDDVFSVLDRGVTRSASDALGIDRKLSEVATFICKVSGHNGVHIASSKPLDEDVKAISEVFAPYHEFLLENVKSSTPVFSTASFRAAACLRMAAGYDKNYIRDVYEALVLGAVHELPKVAQHLVGAVASNRVGSGSGSGARYLDLFSRAWVVFDPIKRDNDRVIVRSNETAVSDLRRIVNIVLNRS